MVHCKSYKSITKVENLYVFRRRICETLAKSAFHSHSKKINIMPGVTELLLIFIERGSKSLC